MIGEPFAGDGHTDTSGDTLPQRAGGGFHSGSPMILRVPGCFAANLTEAADVIECDGGLAQLLIVGVHRLNAGQMQDGPEQHGRMTVGQHETVTVGPDWVLRIKIHHPVPERINQRRQRHGRAGVAGLGRLHGINRKGTDGINRQLFHLGIVHKFSFVRCRSFNDDYFPASNAATLPSRRRWRGAWLNSAARNVVTRSQASSGPSRRPPRQMILRWSSSTPCLAEK